MRHLCPTCPDTLRSYPFVEEDPFIVKDSPHVYFAGCQSVYKEKTIFKNESLIKLVSIPCFRESRAVVLMDLETLQTYEYKIDTALPVDAPMEDLRKKRESEAGQGVELLGFV